MSTESSTSSTTMECCPVEWREVTLGSIADVRFSSVDKLTYPSEKLVRLCNYIDVYKNDYITGDLDFMWASATQPEISRFGLQIGDVIITKDSETPNDIGIPSVVDYAEPDLVCGYHLCLIRPDKNEVDPTFFSKQLSHYRLALYFGRQANGLTRYGLPISAVTNAPLWLPKLEEQKRVGAVLRLIDEAIAKTEAVIAKLKQVHAGLLHDLLTRGLDENGQLRDPIVHPEQFQDSPIGRIPRGWEAGNVSSIAINRDARRVPLKQADRDMRHGIYPYYGASGIIDWIDNYLFDGEFVLIGEDGENLRSRHLPLAFVATGKFWVNNHAHILEPIQGGDFRFLAIILEAQDYIPWLLGSAQPKLTQRNLEQVPLKIPPPYEQSMIADTISDIDEQIAIEIMALHKQTQLKSALIADLLTGRVRVPASL